MATSIDTAAFAEGAQSLFRLLSPSQVEQIGNLGRDPHLEAIVADLARKANEGELTVEEEARYRGYVEANSMLAALRAAARQQKNHP